MSIQAKLKPPLIINDYNNNLARIFTYRLQRFILCESVSQKRESAVARDAGYAPSVYDSSGGAGRGGEFSGLCGSGQPARAWGGGNLHVEI